MNSRERDLQALPAKQRNPLRRVFVALLLSLIAHALIIWTPHIHLPKAPTALPEIAVRLKPLPRKTVKSKPRKKPALPAPPPAVTASRPETEQKQSPEPVAQAASAPATAAAIAASAVPATEAASAPAAASVVAAADNQPPPPESIPFPTHILLTFAVFNGDHGLRLGEVQHSLDITDNHYIVQSHTRTTGIVRWFKSFNLNQTSTGSVFAYGLRPDNFAEEKYNSGDTQALSADFDWGNHQINFSNADSAQLPDRTQDALSILYQLPLTILDREIVTFPLCTGKKLEEIKLDITNNQHISTDIGELDTVRLRRIPEPGQTGLNIWLSKEYRLLPVKIQYLEPDGKISATISITELRYTDD